ncbi:MAG: nucleotide exchange factor GrpE [Kiritimatiellia bacterium]
MDKQEEQELRDEVEAIIEDAEQKEKAAQEDASKIKEELETAKKELAEANEKIAAMHADFDNYRKIAEEKQAKFIEETNSKFKAKIAEINEEHAAYRARTERNLESKINEAVDKLLKDFFPLMDGMDSALANLRQKAEDGNPYLKGFELTHRQLLAFLEKQGIVAMPEMVDKPYDPNLAEAVSILEIPGKKPGSVLFLQRQGYLRGDKVLRAAQVVVQREEDPPPPPPAPEKEQPAEQAPADTETKAETESNPEKTETEA